MIYANPLKQLPFRNLSYSICMVPYHLSICMFPYHLNATKKFQKYKLDYFNWLIKTLKVANKNT